MDDPISRLEVVTREIDRVFGDGYAAAHPELVIAVMQSAAISSRWKIRLSERKLEYLCSFHSQLLVRCTCCFLARYTKALSVSLIHKSVRPRHRSPPHYQAPVEAILQLDFRAHQHMHCLCNRFR